MNSQELSALQEAYNQVYGLDEVSSADYTALAKTKKPRSKESIQARYHAKRLSKPEPETGKKSPRPYYPGGRKGMTQSDRDWSRGADEYGHSGYDGEGGGGSLPKGKKLERQKKTGVSESFDLYDIILSHLLDEGYADTQEAAEAIMVNMSEDWRESIVEEVLDEDANYDRNRKRAAQRAAARNAARDAGKTGAVPGVGYVTPRRESETYRDSAGVERHKSGAKNA